MNELSKRLAELGVPHAWEEGALRLWRLEARVITEVFQLAPDARVVLDTGRLHLEIRGLAGWLDLLSGVGGERQDRGLRLLHGPPAKVSGATPA